MLPVAIGTYTRKEGHVPDGRGVGITVANFDPATGKLEAEPLMSFTEGIVNPSYVLYERMASGAEALFVAQETGDAEGDAVLTLHVDRAAKKFTEVSRVKSNGLANCHAAYCAENFSLWTSGYMSGTVARHKLTDDGELDDEPRVAAFAGTGPNTARQEGPHAHHALPVVTGDVVGKQQGMSGLVIACDLGSDSLWVLDINTGARQEAPLLKLPPGYGPRHAVNLGPLGFAVVCELSARVVFFELSAPPAPGSEKPWTARITGEATTFTDPTNDPLKGATTLPSAIVYHEERQLLFVANRFIDTIAVLQLKDGKEAPEVVTTVEVPCGGHVTRDMSLDPTNRWLLVANQDSHNIAVFSVDALSSATADTSRFVAPVNVTEVFSAASIRCLSLAQ